MFKSNLIKNRVKCTEVKGPVVKNVWTKTSSENCGQYVQEYLEASSLHGMKYIANTNITSFERVFFILSFTMVFALSLYFISNLYEKWSATPVIVTMGAKSTPITDFPFPAVTICNINKARNSIVSQFANGSNQSFWLQNICLDEYANITMINDDVQKATDEWQTFKQYLLNISQPCSKMLLMCRYALDTFKCMDIFNTVLSDEGLCCIFNSVEPTFLYKHPSNASSNFDDDESNTGVTPIDWTPERGYSMNIKQKSTPRPAAGPGSHMGLNVILNSDVSDYYCSSTSSSGFKILLHNPTETPRISDFGMLISPGCESRIVITPKIQTASRLIRKIPIERRQCIFSNEANLSYFRTYSRKNCEMECYSRIIEEICGCVIYYMPRINKSTKICNRANSKCYNSVRISLERGDSKQYKCNCLPGCDELSYTGEYSGAPLTTTHFVKKLADHLINFTDEVIRRDIAIVQIFYAESFFRSNVKDELIGFTEFLASSGGLLGLFMGFSVVSLVEILYFITLRIYCRQFYGQRHLKPATMRKISTISKNHRYVWPIVSTHVQDLDSIKHGKNSLLSSHHSKHYGKTQKIRWKTPNQTIVYPYLD